MSDGHVLLIWGTLAWLFSLAMALWSTVLEAQRSWALRELARCRAELLGWALRELARCRAELLESRRECFSEYTRCRTSVRPCVELRCEIERLRRQHDGAAGGQP